MKKNNIYDTISMKIFLNTVSEELDIMKNLFKNRPKFYMKKSTEREKYEQQYYFRLKVVDYCDAVKNVSKELEQTERELIKDLFTSLKDWRLRNKAYNIFDKKKYNVSISIQSQNSAELARVEITKLGVLGELR